MVHARFKPVPPDQRIRELRKAFATLQKDEPSPERAERLAAFVRDANGERQLNMSMHAAQLCLEDDPDAPALLIAAFEDSDDVNVEERLRALDDLDDLARYIDRPDIREHADARTVELATAWIAEASEAELHHRLRTLTSIRDRAFADTIRDAAR